MDFRHLDVGEAWQAGRSRAVVLVHDADHKSCGHHRYGQPTSKLCRNPFFRLHNTFAAYEGGKHFAVWVDSSAAPEREMLRLNLDCATSIRGCKDVSEMASIAWTKYLSDRPLVDGAKWAEAAQDDTCR